MVYVCTHLAVFVFVYLFVLLLIPGDGCVNGEVRLYGGISPQNGLLEMCIGGHWARVCANQPLDLTIAALVCSQLGYTSTLSSNTIITISS